MIVKLVYSP